MQKYVSWHQRCDKRTPGGLKALVCGLKPSGGPGCYKVSSSTPPVARAPNVTGVKVGRVADDNFVTLSEAPARNGSVAPEQDISFMLSAEQVAQMRAEDNSSREHFLHRLITRAALLSRPPISKYRVGAVALGGSGAVYFGVNVEFVGTPLSNSIHAEQFLLVNCLIHGEREMKAVAVSAAPCGHCRQFYSELVCADTMEFIFGVTDEPATLDELLPRRFGPRDLIEDKSFPLLLEVQDNKVKFSGQGENAWRELHNNTKEAALRSAIVKATEAALKAAQQSYTPYTNSPSGVAIVTHDGGVYAGSYLESAAFNPSLPPFQAAVVSAIVDHKLHDAANEIAHVFLAELPEAPVQQYDTLTQLVKSVTQSSLTSASSAAVTLLPLSRC